MRQIAQQFRPQLRDLWLHRVLDFQKCRLRMIPTPFTQERCHLFHQFPHPRFSFGIHPASLCQVGEKSLPHPEF
jgi:hypothetical protein